MWYWFFFKKWANPGPLSYIFVLFQANINTIFTTNKCKIMSSASSIWRRDLNPQPPEHESSPIITRPGLLWYCLAEFCFTLSK